MNKIRSAKSRSLFGSILSHFFLLGFLLLLLLVINLDSINLVWYFSLALLVFGIALLFTLIFFSQFLFPLNSIDQRIETILHLLRFIFGKITRIAIIRDGQIVSPEIAISNQPVRAIWSDSASAAVVENNIGKQRVFSGGFWFLQNSERLVGLVSLKKQTYTLGPLPFDKPYMPKQPQETFEIYTSRIKKAGETHAVTLDGCEVCATIFIEYQIDNKSKYLRNGFGFDPDSIKKNVYSKLPLQDDGYTIIKSEKGWESIPPTLTARIWKELVQQLKLAQLVYEHNSELSMLKIISNQIQKRLTQATSNQSGSQDGTKITRQANHEFRELYNRGIRVNKVEVTHLHIPELYEKELLNEWCHNILREGELLNQNIRERLYDLDKKARTQALLDFSYALARYSKNQPNTTISPLIFQLTANLKGILYLIRHNPLLVQGLEKDYQQLTNLSDFLIHSKGMTDE